MSSRGRGKNRGGSGGRSNGGASKPTKKNAVRSGVKKGNFDTSPDPPRIRVLKARKAELDSSFKIFGVHQKAALLALAQKSLDATKNDAKYHENLPEYRVLCEGIDNKLNCIMSKLEDRRRYEQELVQRIWEHNSVLIQKNCKYKLRDIKDKAIAKAQERVLYVEKVSQTKSEIKDIPFYNGEDGRKVTKLTAPSKIIHPVAIPFSGVQLADGKSPRKPGDNLLEQHPANFWASCTDEKKRKLTAQLASTIEKNRKIAQNEKYGIYRKRSGTASSLLNLSTASAIDTEVEEDDFQLDEPLTTNDANIQDDQDQAHELSDDAAELPLDSYGVKIPKKKMRAGTGIRPNNYIVTPRNFNFMDAEGQILSDGSIGIQEIGIRTWTTRKSIRNRDYFIGCSISPNPDNFYIPQRVGDINSGNNTLEDMKSVKHITETHKTHPKLGIVLPGSINYDYRDLKDPYFPPPTDRKNPLEGLKPHMIIQENSDGTSKAFKISRSWIHQTNKNFENILYRKKVHDFLEKLRSFDKHEKELEEVCAKSACIDPNLISAASAALEESEKDKIKEFERTPPLDYKEAIPFQASKYVSSKVPSKVFAGTPTKTTRGFSIKSAKRPSLLQYDPVRDSYPTKYYQNLTQQAPYTKSNSRNSNQYASQNSSNMLTELANYALNNRPTPFVSASSRENSSNSRPSMLLSATTQSTMPQNSQVTQRPTQILTQPSIQSLTQPPIQPPIQPSIQPPIQTSVQYLAQTPVQLPSQFSAQFSVQRQIDRQPNSVPVQLQDPLGSLQPINQLVLPQSSQGITMQQYQQSKPTLSPYGFQYPVGSHQTQAQGGYQPPLASQMIYSTQLPPPINYAASPSTRPLNYNVNTPIMTTNIPPHLHHSSNPINYTTRAKISQSYNAHSPHRVIYTQSSLPLSSYSTLEDNRIRELHPPNPQQHPTASVHSPIIHPWSSNRNFH
ncbi:hypothetical protein HI914_04618 [Erysiphe necator]|nr:hypothetical protein HI914_04618 [Erysiphe necator]